MNAMDAKYIEQLFKPLKIARDRIIELERELPKAKQELDETAQRLLENASSDDERAIIGRFIYYYLELNSEILTKFFDCPQQSIWKHVGEFPVQATCRKCKTTPITILVRSKNKMREARKGKHYEKCEECQRAEKEQSLRNAEWSAERNRLEQERINALRAMPYRDYLQTDHWKETRKKALKRSGFSCQTCNAKNVSLHVHHRTYVNRGCEENADLIVLCASCHEVFHENREVQS